MGGTSADIAVVLRRQAAADDLVRPRVGHADPLPEHRRDLDRRRRRLDRLARPGRLSAQRPAERRRRSRAPRATARAATEPTNTDAHLVLGRVSNDLFLDGRMQLDAELAPRRCAARIAEPLGPEPRGRGRGRAADREREHGQGDPPRSRSSAASTRASSASSPSAAQGRCTRSTSRASCRCPR